MSDSMKNPATEASLTHDLRALGVAEGNLLFVHSSYKSLGPLAHGVDDILDALEVAVGATGTILMPSFNLGHKTEEERIANWDVHTTPSSAGYTSEAFRLRPGTARSNHYCHSVAARGRNAAEIVAEHDCGEGMRSPWDHEGFGRDFGEGSPFLKAYRHPQGKILMLGVDYESSTFCHMVETVCWNKRLETDPEAEYLWFRRERFGRFWDELGRLARGKVGQAECRLFPIRDFVDTLTEAAMEAPGRFCRYYKE
jgi:aminoglycoside 3-N-acetyltransferase